MEELKMGGDKIICKIVIIDDKKPGSSREFVHSLR
jgi:hypothetical protein